MGHQKPTLLQLHTIQSMPKNGYNLAKSMRENGYSKQSSYSGSVRRGILRHTKGMDILDPEKIKKDINFTYKLAKKQKDITNMNRNIEFRGKLAGMIVDKSEVDNKNPDKVMVVYGSKPTEGILPVVPDDHKQ